jgi:serine protease Do
MKHFPMFGLAMVLGGFLTAPGVLALGSTRDLPADLGQDFLMYSSQGFLGVELQEIDNGRVTALHLKDTHGAEVVMVDHDAPAGKSGLKVHDVILQLDGQAFDNADQLRRRLRELPAGRNITLLISRDGNPMTFTARLCDRDVLSKQTWVDHFGAPEAGSFLGTSPNEPGFIDRLIPKPLYVGADLNPVHKQLAGYFGVRAHI